MLYHSVIDEPSLEVKDYVVTGVKVNQTKYFSAYDSGVIEIQG
jgi:hypothetical protein